MTPRFTKPDKNGNIGVFVSNEEMDAASQPLEDAFLTCAQSVDIRTGKELASPPEEPWNICPACDELVDVDDEALPGTELDCSNCDTRLVAECYGDGEETEWKLILASEYFDEEPMNPDAEGLDQGICDEGVVP